MPKKSIPDIKNVTERVLVDYQDMSMTLQQVADKNKISSATATSWAKKAGLALRERGRKCRETPTPRQLEIIRLSSIYSYEQVGKRFGLHKQSIHRTVKRWRSLANPKKAPFEPGDILLWRNKKLSVIDSNFQDGTVVDEKGKIYRNFSWNSGRIPKKIGVNPNYVLPTVDVNCTLEVACADD